MKRIHLACLAVLLGSALGAAAQESTPPEVAAHQRQELAHGDPARWYHDDASAAAQKSNLRKEIGAALQQANYECKRGPAGERAACLREAQSNYRRDMTNIDQLRTSTRG
ncbi:hypothetical protein [Rugamonas sp.]|uniref:hypothetical protein n=1 Tax=Rugamonas sp. TaxID=1926287 RepID=UPI0025EB01BF|nr:hypothetical protein [Rugamonas sp.]